MTDRDQLCEWCREKPAKPDSSYCGRACFQAHKRHIECCQFTEDDA